MTIQVPPEGVSCEVISYGVFVRLWSAQMHTPYTCRLTHILKGASIIHAHPDIQSSEPVL